jgi:hypothetical protein
VIRQACAMELEGIVSKRQDAPYRSGRANWTKVTCRHRETFVIAGLAFRGNNGGWGNDTLISGAGDDRLFGGGHDARGSDTFEFQIYADQGQTAVHIAFGTLRHRIRETELIEDLKARRRVPLGDVAGLIPTRQL